MISHLDAIADAILTGDVPISIRMQVSSDSPGYLIGTIARDAIKSGQFKGMNRKQIIAKLKQNRAEADAEDADDKTDAFPKPWPR